MMKTDKRDALGLANTLYNQLALGVQVMDKTQLVRRAVPPTPAAAQLKGFIRHRYEEDEPLSHSSPFVDADRAHFRDQSSANGDQRGRQKSTRTTDLGIAAQSAEVSH